MVGTSHILHAAEIIGAFLVAHHFWPKGVTYGDKEEWEERHHKKQGKKSASSSSKKNRPSGGGSRRNSRYEDERDLDRDRRRSRRAEDYVERRGSRYYDYDDRGDRAEMMDIPAPRSVKRDRRRERDYY